MDVIFAISLESIFRLIVALIMFVFVILLCYYTTQWLAKYQKGRFGKGNIEVLEAYNIGNNKCIEIVRVGRQCYILGVSKDHIEKIDVIDEKELTFSEVQPVDIQESFSQILDRIRKNKQDKE